MMRAVLHSVAPLAELPIDDRLAHAARRRVALPHGGQSERADDRLAKGQSARAEPRRLPSEYCTLQTVHLSKGERCRLFTFRSERKKSCVG